jgi:hypothetical protein
MSPAAPVLSAPVAPTAPAAAAEFGRTAPLPAISEPVKPTGREARAAAAKAKADAKAAKDAEVADAKEAAVRAKADARAAKADAKADAKAAKAKPTPAENSPAARLGLPTPSASRVETPAPKQRERSVRPAVAVIAIVLGLALLVAVAVFLLSNRGPSASGATGTSAVDPLLVAQDVAPLAAGSWQESTVTGSPLCIGTPAPEADRTAVRKWFTAANDSVLQTVGTYADDATATKAYDAQALLAGTCPDGSALIVGASDVKGLADSAQAVDLKVQAVKDENHVLLLTRTGRTVNSFDIVTAAGVPVTTIAQVAATSLNRQCAGGTCPAAISVASALPAAGTPAGWLVPADLPRITAGTGKWTGHDWPVNTPGSGCEGTDLTKVSGTSASGQRTLILTNDTKSPASFGVDQVNFTYAEPKAAQTLATSLTKAISTCAKRLPTATVNDGPTIKGSGQSQVAISGQTWEITQKTTTSTFIYRVAVVVSGNQVTYLLANPNKAFDFTDSAWQAAALRAAQRASQAS